METTGKPGRPRKEVKQINPTRQIGRWTDEDWAKIQSAAVGEGTSVADWARRILLRAAKRRQSG